MSLHTAIGVGASEVLSNECTVAQGLVAVRRLGAKCRGLIHPSAWKGYSQRFKNLRCLLLLRTHHHHWAVSMSDHRVRDAAYQRSPHSTESPATHDDQPRPYSVLR